MKGSGIVVLFKVMRWVIKTVLVVFGVLPFAGCGSGYREKNGKVTFNGKEIQTKNFVVLSETFAKDDSAAYYKEFSIPGADVKSFKAVGKQYASDDKQVYYCDTEREGQNYYLTKHSVIVTLKNADPESFKIVGDGYAGYAKDKLRGYLNGIGFAVKDVASLEIIGGEFVKDKYQVYFQQQPFTKADVKTFRILNNFYARDTNRIYYYGYHNDVHHGIYEINCNPNTFQMLEYPYARDDQSVFCLYTKIERADAATFTVLGNDYAKDKQHVYMEAAILKDADAASFIRIPGNENSLDEESYFTKDKNHIFWKSKVVQGADINSFKALGLGYATDGKQVFYHQLLVNADPLSFKIYDHSYGDADAEDARRKFLKGSKVEINQQ